jgi:hypothetical protein
MLAQVPDKASNHCAPSEPLDWAQRFRADIRALAMWRTPQMAATTE